MLVLFCGADCNFRIVKEAHSWFHSACTDHFRNVTQETENGVQRTTIGTE